MTRYCTDPADDAYWDAEDDKQAESFKALEAEVEDRLTQLLHECQLEDTEANRRELRDQAWQEVTESLEDERELARERMARP